MLGQRRERGGGGRKDKERLIKLRVPRDVPFTRSNLPQKHICSAKVPTDSRASRTLAPFVVARIFQKRRIYCQNRYTLYNSKKLAKNSAVSRDTVK